MKKYPVYAQTHAWKFVGEMEADSLDDANNKLDDWLAEKDYPSISINISNDFDIGDTEYEIGG